MAATASTFQRLWVFSDLHLTESTDSLYSSFIKALEEPSTAQDVVVFAGDIFDIFVGNSEHFITKHKAFFSAIRTLSEKKVQLFYIQGNHDFCLEPAFAGTAVQVLDRELVLNKIYIAHGDLIDESDYGYLLLRKWFRSSLFNKMVRLAPGALVEAIGNKMTRPYQQKNEDLKNVPNSVRSKFRAFAESKKRQGYDFVILGHCHDFDEIKPFYFNTGYPPVHRQYLFYSTAANSFIRRIFAGI